MVWRILFMAITAIAAYWSTEDLLQANTRVQHTFLVIGDAEEIRANLVEHESARRGYVETGDERFLESVEGLRTRIAESRKRVRELTVDDPAQRRRPDLWNP
jgi:CHASE3 domain sensor protein